MRINNTDPAPTMAIAPMSKKIVVSLFDDIAAALSLGSFVLPGFVLTYQDTQATLTYEPSESAAELVQFTPVLLQRYYACGIGEMAAVHLVFETNGNGEVIAFSTDMQPFFMRQLFLLSKHSLYLLPSLARTDYWFFDLNTARPKALHKAIAQYRKKPKSLTTLLHLNQALFELSTAHPKAWQAVQDDSLNERRAQAFRQSQCSGDFDAFIDPLSEASKAHVCEHLQAQLIDAEVLPKTPNTSRARALFVGMGTGENRFLIARCYPNIECHGIEPEKHFYEQAMARYAFSRDLSHQCSLANSPYQPNEFDYVFVFNYNVKAFQDQFLRQCMALVDKTSGQLVVGWARTDPLHMLHPKTLAESLRELVKPDTLQRFDQKHYKQVLFIVHGRDCVSQT